jgi:DNA polymerase
VCAADPQHPANPDLAALAEVAAGCRECGLCEQRKTVVFGEGDANARVLFIGEGPGAEEDPFVGQAGRVLDGMIFAMGLERSQVYITNIVKCRPPGNRDPRDEEVAACSPFLDRQIELICPDVIVALGKPAAHRLTGTKKPIGALRGRWQTYKNTPLMPVFHPAFMLRNPKAKREAWEDLKLIAKRLASLAAD